MRHCTLACIRMILSDRQWDIHIFNDKIIYVVEGDSPGLLSTMYVIPSGNLT